jgi:lipoprotein-anchoring transpeptidase ErfK/SrfK
MADFVPMDPRAATESVLDRRAFVTKTSIISVGLVLGACATAPPSTIDPAYLRTEVPYNGREASGTLVVDPQNHYLYFVQKGGRALRYGVGVGAEGFGWSGVATVRSKQEWPDWYPTEEMLQRKPELRRSMTQLQSGLGIPGGPENPLGARALYLWQGNRDTLYRIHGTNEPGTIGRNVSSGCIRLTNDDITDLYDRTPVGTKVVVLLSPSAQRMGKQAPV